MGLTLPRSWASVSELHIPLRTRFLVAARKVRTAAANSGQDELLQAIKQLQQDLVGRFDSLEQDLGGRIDSLEQDLGGGVDSVQRSLGALRESHVRQEVRHMFGDTYANQFMLRSLQDLVRLLPDRVVFHGECMDQRDSLGVTRQLASELRGMPLHILRAVQAAHEVSPARWSCTDKPQHYEPNPALYADFRAGRVGDRFARGRLQARHLYRQADRQRVQESPAKPTQSSAGRGAFGRGRAVPLDTLLSGQDSGSGCGGG